MHSTFMSVLASQFHSCTWLKLLRVCLFVFMFSCTWLKLLRVCLFVYMFINFVFTSLIENGVCTYSMVIEFG